MSTPEIDLHNMLKAEERQEARDDAYTRWLEYDVIPSLAGALAAFNYEKFDAFVEYYMVFNGERIIDWLFGMITDNYDVYYGLIARDPDDINFTEIAETYINCFVCEQNFIDYNREVICNDHS